MQMLVSFKRWMAIDETKKKIYLLDSPPHNQSLMVSFKRDYGRKSGLLRFPKKQKDQKVKYFDTPPMLKKTWNAKNNRCQSPDY